MQNDCFCSQIQLAVHSHKYNEPSKRSAVIIKISRYQEVATAKNVFNVNLT